MHGIATRSPAKAVLEVETSAIRPLLPQQQSQHLCSYRIPVVRSFPGLTAFTIFFRNSKQNNLTNQQHLCSSTFCIVSDRSYQALHLLSKQNRVFSVSIVQSTRPPSAVSRDKSLLSTASKKPTIDH